MNSDLDQLLQRQDIEKVLNTYARACDGRHWQHFDTIFAPDVEVNYGGEFKLQGREKVVAMIQSMLGGCGPTQHLLGNFDIEVQGDIAHCNCYVRAVHAGVNEQEEMLYEVWAEYRDQLHKNDTGWRITQRQMVVHKEVGSRAILKPAL
ncbi:MAG: 3-phenylpropionate/cinnamic acid dioxygenase small subunit [Halioglobus sp.]|jgi:3-phenylpropionate/cinnamic acid dioxygenase small subunit